MAIVYIHRRADNPNIVFYVGIGANEKRAYNFYHSRNSFWKTIYKKHGVIVEITHKGLIWEEACAIEKYLIAFYGRKDISNGSLCNLTDGGDGVANWSEEMKMNHSIVQKKVQCRKDLIEKRNNANKKLRENEEFVKRLSTSLKKVLGTDFKRKENSERRKVYFQDEINLKKHRELMSKIHGSPEMVKKNRTAQTNYWKDKRILPTGVYCVKKEYYKAKISINNRCYNIYYSKSIEECSKAYQLALRHINDIDFIKSIKTKKIEEMNILLDGS